MPAHPAAHELLTRFGSGVAAPSANRFGRVSPPTAAHVLTDLAVHLQPGHDLVLDGGTSAVGVESTIVDLTVDPPQLLRPGGIPGDLIAGLLAGSGGAERSGASAGSVEFGSLAAASGPSRASGMLASHYAPRARVVLVDDTDAAARAVELAGDSVTRVLDYDGDTERYAAESPARPAVPTPTASPR